MQRLQLASIFHSPHPLPLCLLLVCTTWLTIGTHAQALSPDLVICGAGAPVLCSNPASVFIDAATRDLWVSDTNNHRVLRYPTVDNLTATTSPSSVLGQMNYVSTSPNQGNPNPSKKTLNTPRSVFVDSKGTLWVTDGSNHRVLWWPQAHTRPIESPAMGVIGQTSFTASSSGTTSTTYTNPTNAWVTASGDLYVSDGGNNRVLRYNNASKLPPNGGGAADGVLGQSDLGTGSAGTTSATSLSGPTAVIGDASGNTLFVSDTNTNRVLYYSQATTDGSPAAFAFGQSLFSTFSVGATSATTLSNPTGLASSPSGELFIASTSENRILVYPYGANPDSMNPPAAWAIGQLDLTTTSATYLNGPTGIFYDAPTNSLWVADSGNNRVVRYSNILINSATVSANVSALLDVSLLFNGPTPIARLTPKDDNGQQQPEASIVVTPSLLEEKDATNNTVVSQAIPAAGYNVSTMIDANNTQQYTFSLANPPLTLSYSLFAQAIGLNSAGISFSSKPSGLKLTVSIGRWNFLQPTNTLSLTLLVDFETPFANISANNTNPDISEIAISSSNSTGLTTTITLLDRAEVDGVDTPITHEIFSQGQQRLKLVLHFPYYNNTLYYDPDFSLLLTPSDNGNNDNNSEDSADSSLLALLALLGLLIPATALVLIAVGTAWYLVRRARRVKEARQAVNADVNVVNF